ncbi:L-serine ammonia-lyase [Shewanella surugensis]|uniref:L-serine dehydratase n=1 Tax=Shewanella surugensis TaxID=212020 RepID=A0ABT0L9S6_9GAMM|nr:L-serine ammonia-lyase [Shewanella surugensis]MCL1123906.1 L-serine ammonia-lyase [Shewanella surugensis]
MISVFDMFKIGIGPSSSHTVGPMKAGNVFINALIEKNLLEATDELRAELFGSLGQTGRGHGTDKAVILGLMSEAPDTVNTDIIDATLKKALDTQSLTLTTGQTVTFTRESGITFHRRKTLPAHANAMTLYAYAKGQCLYSRTYYSVGGGFILDEDEIKAQDASPAVPIKSAPFDFNSAAQLLTSCTEHGFSISALMMQNELSIRSEEDIKSQLWHIWQTMRNCIERGYQKEGILPGGLKLRRRAPSMYRRLKAEGKHNTDPLTALDWVDLYALSVNEQNAAGDRVVTAPTNGAAGIIPAVLSYYDAFVQPVDMDVCCRYLLTAAAIGILYKKNASISGAEVGCQGEVGVACSMAAAALTEIMGGTVEHVENAAEIGMEHNLGLTCDPVGGLVQVPCIERNAMGAVKAINASRMALRGDGNHKVTLDKVIKTMMDTGQDMRSKYKETAKGGLAVNIVEC